MRVHEKGTMQEESRAHIEQSTSDENMSNGYATGNDETLEEGDDHIDLNENGRNHLEHEKNVFDDSKNASVNETRVLKEEKILFKKDTFEEKENAFEDL